MGTSELIVLSPLEGWSTPLEEAPDEVFAGRMLGDGVGIDPLGSTLCAPFDGILTAVPATRHAVTLRAPNGAELLLHVGIDTVGLGGEGFELHVRQGQQVRAGERLISFDLDLLARRAKSVLTPVILVDGSGFRISRRQVQRMVRVGDFLMEIQPAEALSIGTQVAPSSGENSSAHNSQTRTLTVMLEHGVHARPAAACAAAVKNLSAEIRVSRGSREANARSPIALMALGIQKGDRVSIEASGVEAARAVSVLEQLLTESALKATSPVALSTLAAPLPGASAAESARALAVGPDTGSSSTALRGVVAGRGMAVGRIFLFAHAHIEVRETGGSVDFESGELERARGAVRAELERTMASGHGAAGEIAAAHLQLLDDPELVTGARELISTGKSAAFAWQFLLRKGIRSLQALDDPRMAERADDLLDLESRVLSRLTGGAPAERSLPEDSVLVAQELLPSQLTALDAGRLAGICLAGGGPTSHVAIIAAAMSVPTLVAMGPQVLRIPAGTTVVLDADSGLLYPQPPPEQLEQARQQLVQRRRRSVIERSGAQKECRTLDGQRILVFANLGSIAEAAAAAGNGAEGCGLLRTEFLFLERHAAPDEAEQLEQYQEIATALGGKPLTIRTLDIGGDKPIAYLPLPPEDNPALGLRGVRTSLWRPDLLQIQLRAILRVRPLGQCRIMLPMITDPGEIRTVRHMLEELVHVTAHDRPVRLGVMIETPASAVMADRMAREADFFSIGTNDLTQYTLAMDRGHPDLAVRLDALHPAVLRLIRQTVESARAHDRPVAVCGGLASDPAAVPVLIGLGIHELSMVPAVIPQMKMLIGAIDVASCTRLANDALALESAEEVRALALRHLAHIQPAALREVTS